MITWLKRFSSNETFHGRPRAVETAGFAILLVGLFLVWQPLGWIVLGIGVVAYAQLMRR